MLLWAVLNRRSIGSLLLAAVLFGLLPAGSAAVEQRVLRIGLTPVFLDDQIQVLRDWAVYLEQRLGSRVQFVQRQTYREITDQLLQGSLDAAWLCGFPYVKHRPNLQLLAVPLYRGKPLYQSYLIVPATDTGTTSLEQLRGKVFAFSDPDSNSGYLVTATQIVDQGSRMQRFFRRTFFTWSHQGVIQAVADGLAQGGAVDGYIWETLRLTRPDLVNRTRVVTKSMEYGFPPFVTTPNRSTDGLQRVLLSMNQDPSGRELLQRLNLDGFITGSPQLYDDIASSMRRYEAR